MSAAFELNGKIFEVVTTLPNAWLDFVSRRSAEATALPRQLST